MNITQDLTIIELIANASILVKGVMVLLAAVSVMSWYWIFRKWFAIRDVRAKTDQFERDFWSGGARRDDWTKLDVWQYIARERLGLPSIYFTHKRAVVVRRTGALAPVTELPPLKAGEAIEELSVRFRTAGDIT